MRKIHCGLAASFAVVLAACQSTAPQPEPKTASAAPAASAPTAYSGHGLDSVNAETLAKFAPTPLPPAVTQHIQAMLDVRSPGAGHTSQNGKRLYFSWAVTGVPQIWRLDGPRQFPVQMTGGEDPTTVADIAPDDSFLVVSRDHAGEENPGLYLQHPDGGPLTAIQHVKGVQTFLDFITADAKWIYFHANDVKPDSFAIYRWERATGKRETVFDKPGLWSVADHRPEGKLLLQKDIGSNQAEFWDFDPKTQQLDPVIGQNEREDFNVRYAAQAGEYLVQTPKLGEFRRLYRLKGQALTAVSPEMKHDVSGFTIDEPRHRILYEVNEDGYTRLHALDARTYREIALPELPAADNVNAGQWSRDGRFVALIVDTATAPPRSYVLDWKTGKLVQWHQPSAPEIDTSTFAVATLESYPARDGTKIPMFVRRPAACAKAALPCPVIVIFHGGPEAQTTAGFNTSDQVFVDAGFIVAEPNVRGSDGYGKTWIHADDAAKRLDIITDIEDASRYVRSAWAKNGKAPKVGIFGGSYGGYSSLIGMTMFAGAYDAGVEVVGISNLLTFLNNTAPYRRALRISEYGDPERDHDALVKLSPLTYVDRVAGPMLLIQGANDPRVPVGEAVQVQQALEKKGLPNQLIIFADEGHGARKRGNRALQLGHTLRFFEEHLAPN